MDGNPAPPRGYLDALGGQPLLPAAAAALAAARGRAWADPTRLHHAGREAGQLLDAARASIATCLTAMQEDGSAPVRPAEVFLTASATQAQALALRGQGPLTAGAVESVALLDLVEASEGSTVVGVDRLGRADAALFPATGMRVLQAANPEVGTRQPIAELASGALLMDAGQTIGHDRIPAGWTTLIAAARDWGGPAGVALLVIRGGRRPAGVAHLRGWLDGFPDIAAAVGAAAALEWLAPRWQALAERDHARIARIREAAHAIDDVEVVGDPDDRLPHVATFSVLYASGESLVHALDSQGYAVASGSACVDESARPSHVLAAMGAFTGGNIRVSLPFGCTDETIDGFIAALGPTIARLRDDLVESR